MIFFENERVRYVMRLLLESEVAKRQEARTDLFSVSAPGSDMAAPRLEVGIAATLRLTDASSGNPRLRLPPFIRGT